MAGAVRKEFKFDGNHPYDSRGGFLYLTTQVTYPKGKVGIAQEGSTLYVLLIASVAQ